MKLIVSLGLAWAAMCVAFGARAVTPPQTLPVETLSGTKLSVPGDLPKKPVVFVVGFSKASKDRASAWSRALEKRFSPDAVAVYGVSVIEDVPGLLRGFVARSIRHGVPESLHDRFLLVTQQSAAWKRMTAWKESDDAFVVLMNVARKIVWRTHGPVTGKKLQALADALKPHASEAVADTPIQASGKR